MLMRRWEDVMMQMRCSSADVFYEESFADAPGKKKEGVIIAICDIIMVRNSRPIYRTKLRT